MTAVACSSAAVASDLASTGTPDTQLAVLAAGLLLLGTGTMLVGRRR